MYLHILISIRSFMSSKVFPPSPVGFLELHQLASRHHPVKHPGGSTTTNQGAKPRCEKLLPTMPSDSHASFWGHSKRAPFWEGKR